MDIRLRFFIILAVALLALAVWTFPSWYPLVRPQEETIVIVFEGLAPQLQDDFLALPEAERNAYAELSQENRQMALDMVRARLSPAPNVTPQALTDEATLQSGVRIRTGTFVTIDAIHRGAGDVSIYELPDQRRIMQIRNFSVLNGPQLHLVFSTDPAPLTGAQVGANYIDLGPLPTIAGDLEYVLPPSVDLSRYQSVVVLDVRYNMVYSNATLR